MPFLPPNQQRQSTEGKDKVAGKCKHCRADSVPLPTPTAPKEGKHEEMQREKTGKEGRERGMGGDGKGRVRRVRKAGSGSKK